MIKNIWQNIISYVQKQYRNLHQSKVICIIMTCLYYIVYTFISFSILPSSHNSEYYNDRTIKPDLQISDVIFQWNKTRKHIIHQTLGCSHCIILQINPNFFLRQCLCTFSAVFLGFFSIIFSLYAINARQYMCVNKRSYRY